MKKCLSIFICILTMGVVVSCSNINIDPAVEDKVRGGYEDVNGTLSAAQSSDKVTNDIVIPSPEELEMMEDEVICLTNEYRVELGLNELAKDNELTYVARIRAQEIVTTWSHIRADGSMYVDILDAIKYPSPLVGENLGRYQDSSTEVVQMWKESPGHNANLIGDYNKIGVGIYVTERGKLHYVQIFAK